jgi:hypothetical protein
MIVWGGFREYFESADPSLNSGGIYDPVSDSWSATSIIGAPYDRFDPTAVWTGEKMLVWGGQVTQGYSNGGGIYCGIFPPHYYQDTDADGYGNSASTLVSCTQPAGYAATPGDCNDGDAGLWTTPTEALNVRFTSPSTLQWDVPGQPGASSVLYDAIRSSNPADFVNGASCLATDTSSLTASDATAPALGATLNYLVRAQNSCPSGAGPLGFASSGNARTGLNCP